MYQLVVGTTDAVAVQDFGVGWGVSAMDSDDRYQFLAHFIILKMKQATS